MEEIKFLFGRYAKFRSQCGEMDGNAVVDRCPLYPQKQTFAKANTMSAMCQKRTWALYSIMPHAGGSHCRLRWNDRAGWRFSRAAI